MEQYFSKVNVHLHTELQNNTDLRLSVLHHFPVIKHNLLIFPQMS